MVKVRIVKIKIKDKRKKTKVKRRKQKVKDKIPSLKSLFREAEMAKIEIH